MTSPFLFNGITTHYALSGSGPWLVLCHALASDAGVWREQIAALGHRFSILAFDLPGHGRSPARTDGNYSFNALAANLIALMDHLGIDNAHLAGISIGGELAQVAAAGHPTRFRKLVLISTACYTDAHRRQLWEQRMIDTQQNGMAAMAAAATRRWFREEFYQAHPQLIQECEARIARTALPAYLALAEVIQHMDLRPQIAGIRCPTLIVYGDEDHNTGQAAASLIRSRIPHARMECIVNAGHFPILEQPEDTNRQLLSFLQ